MKTSIGKNSFTTNLLLVQTLGAKGITVRFEFFILGIDKPLIIDTEKPLTKRGIQAVENDEVHFFRKKIKEFHGKIDDYVSGNCNK